MYLKSSNFFVSMILSTFLHQNKASPSKTIWAGWPTKSDSRLFKDLIDEKSVN